MDQIAIIKICKELGCCNACCLRYIGLKNPTAYENSSEYVRKLLEGETGIQANNSKVAPIEDGCKGVGGGAESVVESGCAEGPAAKRARAAAGGASAADESGATCVSCLGVLQEHTWGDALRLAEDVLREKGYECNSFACALSAPVATALRERALCLQLTEAQAHYDAGGVTALKEAWKWSCGAALAARLGLRLESGAVAPLLLSVALHYADEEAELEVLAALAPEARGRGRGAGVTRRAGEAGAARAGAAALAAAGWARPPRPAAPARARAVSAEHEPLYLAGRYVKLSRALPQTPWVVGGERVLPSSVQEVILEPIARALGLAPEEAGARLKFLAAGREDVDVRCLGTGRPFAVEVSDPRRAPAAAALARACGEVSRGGQVALAALAAVPRARLADLKRGEETKSKTYEALCIKLGHAPEDIAERGADSAVEVTARDVARVRAWRGALRQRTPLRVLHRRPLLERARAVARVHAARVPGAPALLALRVRTDAGTYVKEWAHGDLRRTRPALAHVLRAPADILALDVTHVHLDWP